MKHCLALRHVLFEDLGLFAEPLRRHGYHIRYIDTPLEELGPDEAIDADLLVALGGPVGVHDMGAYPWLAPELQAIAGRLASNRPTLGVCLGAQLMAASLGAAVVKSQAVEIGWAPLDLNRAGISSPLAFLEDLPVLHWHGDRFELPDGAVDLASTALCPYQAFAVGRHGLALQFHAEVNPTRFEHWLVANAAELSGQGLEPAELRRSTLLHGAAVTRAAPKMIDAWVEGLA